MQVAVLGPVEARTRSGSVVALAGPKMRGVLGVLALDPGRPVSPGRLIETVWGSDAEGGPNVVQVTVSKLRRLLAEAGEDDRITTVPAGYLLDVEPLDIDALAFEHLVNRARRETLLASRLELFQEAISLWRGDPLAGAPSTHLLDAHRARLAEHRQLAVEDAVETQLGLGLHRVVIPEIEAMVTDEPLRERRWALLIRALYGAGQQVDALRAFQRARTVFVEQMGIEPSADLRRLETAVLEQDDTILDPPMTDPRRRPAPETHGPVGSNFRRTGNLRHPIGGCIGRERETERLRSLLERHRLVTLTGPGGVGKTRLAQEVGGLVAPSTIDGVWWVDLLPARDVADVLAALHNSLQIEPGTGPTEASLIDLAATLNSRAAVIVVDNCEHVVATLAPIVTELLEGCPELRIIATSRAPLDVQGEVIFAVPPLPLPHAVALFHERLGSPDLDEFDAAAPVARICDRIDCLPLAVELAAARARHLSLADILDRLSDRYEVLQARQHGRPPRQVDLRAVADWSYQLLDDTERAVFERLSVFTDGATSSAARTVCANGPISVDQVEPVLHRLVDRSLVFVASGVATTRYRMLQTLLDFARERLAERGALDDAQRAHAEWVHRLVSTVEFGNRVTGASVAAVQAETAAVRDAVMWGLVNDPVLAVEVCTKAAAFWRGTMRVTAGWELLSAALDALGDHDRRCRSAALPWAALFATMVHDHRTADRLTAEAWADERPRADPVRLGRLAYACALAAGYRGDSDPQPWLDEATRHFTACGSVLGLAHVRFAEGAARLVGGDLETAHAALTDAASVFRREGDHLGRILAVSRLGELAWRRADLEGFAELHLELLRLGHDADSPAVVTGATARLAHAQLLLGRHDDAKRLADEALSGAGGGFMAVIDGYVFKTAGLVNLALGHTSLGRSQLLRAADAFTRRAGHFGTGLAATCWLDLCHAALADGSLAAAREAAGRALDVATACGDPWVIERAVAARDDLR